MAFMKPVPKITLYLIGDSTLSVKEKKAYPETGWGMPFAVFFDAQVRIDNRAQNGRSTKSFLAENRWQPVADSLKEGDYVLIQFGHNDEAKEKTDRYTAVPDFKNNLLKFVKESRSKGAKPILITPVSRRKFDQNGNALETHKEYTQAVIDVATQEQVPLIDLDQKSRALYQKFGVEQSKLLFNQLEAGVHPNYPEGKMDNTHFNELGAKEIAQIVLQEIKKLEPGLAAFVVKSSAVK
eukprot:gene17611-21007_t